MAYLISAVIKYLHAKSSDMQIKNILGVKNVQGKSEVAVHVSDYM